MLNKSNYQSKQHVWSLTCDNINKESDSGHLRLNFWFMTLEHMPHYNMLKLTHFTFFTFGLCEDIRNNNGCVKPVSINDS
jgi:hypothetical protein